MRPSPLPLLPPLLPARCARAESKDHAADGTTISNTGAAKVGRRRRWRRRKDAASEGTGEDSDGNDDEGAVLDAGAVEVEFGFVVTAASPRPPMALVLAFALAFVWVPKTPPLPNGSDEDDV